MYDIQTKSPTQMIIKGDDESIGTNLNSQRSELLANLSLAIHLPQLRSLKPLATLRFLLKLLNSFQLKPKKKKTT
jgi:hypothetical protein